MSCGADTPTRPIVRYEEDAGDAGVSSALAVAHVQWHAGCQTTGWGRAGSAALARLKGLGEAVERHACAQPLPMRLARQVDLPHAMDPASVVRYAPAQYATQGFRFKPADAQAERGSMGSHGGASPWRSWRTASWGRMSLRRRTGPAFTQSQASGFAFCLSSADSHSDWCEAIFDDDMNRRAL